MSKDFEHKNFMTVKSLLTNRFEIELIQDRNGRYCIRYTNRGEEKYSEWITDFLTASYLFDAKLQELEGQ